MPPPSQPRRIAVLGGGPAGLSAAHHLLHTFPSSPPLRVDLYESSSRLGGAVETASSRGLSSFELGPSSMNLKHPAVAHLIRHTLGLLPHLQPRNPAAKRYYLARDGRLVPLPTTPIQFVTSSLLSWKAKLRLLAEPLVPKSDATAGAHGEESVGAFFARRFGPEVVDYIIDPMLAGIYSARPAELSVKHAFSRVWALEQQKGSVLGGMLFGGNRKTPPDPRYAAYTGKELRASISYDAGMRVLTDALAARVKQLSRCERGKKGGPGGGGGGGEVYRRSKVRTLERDGDGAWRVNGRGKYDAVISTIPVHALGGVYSNVAAVEKGFRRLEKQVRYAPVAVVVLGYERGQIRQAMDGFGALFPSKEGRRILGVNFTSANFPGKVKDKTKAYVTVYVGGSRNPELVYRPAREVVEVSKQELKEVMGVQGEPFFSRVRMWTKGIPQYPPGFDEALCTMARLEKKAPGLILGGNYRDGVGLPDALLSGIKAADRVIKFLDEKPKAR